MSVSSEFGNILLEVTRVWTLEDDGGGFRRGGSCPEGIFPAGGFFPGGAFVAVDLSGGDSKEVFRIFTDSFTDFSGGFLRGVSPGWGIFPGEFVCGGFPGRSFSGVVRGVFRGRVCPGRFVRGFLRGLRVRHFGVERYVDRLKWLDCM